MLPILEYRAPVWGSDGKLKGFKGALNRRLLPGVVFLSIFYVGLRMEFGNIFYNFGTVPMVLITIIIIIIIIEKYVHIGLNHKQKVVFFIIALSYVTC